MFVIRVKKWITSTTENSLGRVGRSALKNFVNGVKFCIACEGMQLIRYIAVRQASTQYLRGNGIVQGELAFLNDMSMLSFGNPILLGCVGM